MEPFGAVGTGVVDANSLKDMVGPWGLEPQTSTVSIARIGITITYETAGTAKVRGSHTRHTFCGLGCGLEIRERNVRLFDAERLSPSR